MLTQLNIANYAITERIDLDFDPGMTVMTGETGAGKSITLDALGLALGDRADSKSVGPYSDRAEIYAGFDVSDNIEVSNWFTEHDLPENGGELLLRRLIHADGKSRAYINGKPATLQNIKSLGTLLVDIHGQHDHQSLLKRDHQRKLLDAYADSDKLASQLNTQVRHCRQLAEQIAAMKNKDKAQMARIQLLRYQVDELALINSNTGELAELELEYKALAGATDNLTVSHQVLSLCGDEPNGAGSTLGQAVKLLEELPHCHNELAETRQLLDSARIQASEAERALQIYITGIEVNPARLAEVEQRLSTLYQVARKHHIQADEIPALYDALNAELATLDGGEEKLASLESQWREQCELRDQLAAELTRQRQEASTRLASEVNTLLGQLSMPHCHFQVTLTALPETGLQGAESIDFLIGGNREQTAQPIHKIASGGELARIGLAIQVATSHTSGTPTLIFDEVDAGIGGGVAEIVGQLLCKLGQSRQVFCITHLAQVACQGEHHFVVVKQSSSERVHSAVNQLKEEEKVTEIARMLGGIAITDQTLAHAQEMLSIAH